MKDDIFHTPLPKGAGRPVQLARAVRRHGHGLWQQPESREGLSALVPHREDLRAVVDHAAGLLGRPHQDVGEPQFVEGRPDHAAVSVLPPKSGHFRGLCRPGRPQGRPRVISKYIISDMYAKAVAGAWLRKKAVKSAHAELVKIYA